MIETRRIDGRTVTFRRETGRAPALICIHGSADNHHVYDRLLDALPERSRTRVALIDGSMTSWYGSRASQGLAYLREFRQSLN